MRSTIGLCLAAALAAACGSSEDKNPRDTAGAAGAPAEPAMTCEFGQQACHCPDGTMSGLQLCDQNTGDLLPCSCYTPPADPTPAQPVDSDPNADTGAQEVTRVCAALEGTRECDARSYASDEIPASILFVVDRSGSMACNPPPVQSVEACNQMPIAADPAQPSRWEITVEALKSAAGELQDTNASAGLTFFNIDNGCGVNSTPSVGVNLMSGPQLSAISAALDGISPRGGTPIVGAVVLAYAHLHQEAMAPGNRYVVLLTDGEESCGFRGEEEDAADLAAARKHLLEVEVQKARDANIRTFVIGAPGSEGARGFLSQLAFAGGTALSPDCQHGDPESDVGDCHYDLTKGADFARVLGDALGDISGQALGCEFPTPSGNSPRINVQYTGTGEEVPTCLALDERPCDAGADGFQFAKRPDGTEDLSRVVLCGAACERVKSDPGIQVDVTLGCDPVVVE
jgi:hypothetical protein